MAPLDATASLWTELKRLGPVLASLLLLAVVAAFSQPAGAQGTCGDGICDPGETALTCLQDCAILLLDEDFEDGQAQGWYYDPSRWTIVDAVGRQITVTVDSAVVLTYTDTISAPLRGGIGLDSMPRR